MNKNYSIIFAALLLFSLGITVPADLSAESAIRVPLSMSYNSTYWWRGVELNGKGVGVLWLGAGLELAGTGLTFNVYSAVPEDYLVQSDTSTPERQANRDYQKSITEFDYGFSYERAIGDMLTVGASLYYVHYPFYDELDPAALDTSFIEGSIFIGVKTILNPKVTFFYDYFTEERIGADGEETPVNEDYYIHFALSQPLIESQGFTFSLGGWVGYYNNAYYEASGWSDAGATLAFTHTHGDATFTGNFNYARSLTKDFQVEYTDVGVLKNHLWVEFEVTYKI
jgi:hypothetical protein